jgi:serine/threonine protein kinase
VFAIKVYEKFKINSEPSKFRNIRKEINILTNLSHNNVVRLIEHTETLTKINLVLEYCGSTNISHYVKKKHPLPEEDIRSVLLQTLNAMEYLHSRNIVHRDLKGHNLLINRHKRVKLIDFGFAILTNKGRKLSSVCGTPNYMAPEVLKNEDYVGEPVDIWSFGVLAFYVSECNYPFKAQNVK